MRGKDANRGSRPHVVTPSHVAQPLLARAATPNEREHDAAHNAEGETV